LSRAPRIFIKALNRPAQNEKIDRPRGASC
jgi:hypothetical protein